jgi:hypothetical protein
MERITDARQGTKRDADLAPEVRSRAGRVADRSRGEPHNLWLRSLRSVRVSDRQ